MRVASQSDQTAVLLPPTTSFPSVFLTSFLTAAACRDERQRWELAEACLTHLRLWMEALEPAAAAGPEPLAVPGVMALVDLLGEAAPSPGH